MLEKESTRGRVLVVDDDEIALEITRARLEHLGFEVQTRSSALGTAAHISELKPDILIVDVNMPVLSGVGLLEVVGKRKLGDGMAVILQSSLPLAELQAMASKLGALGALTKTADDAMFAQTFERLARRVAKRPAQQ